MSEEKQQNKLDLAFVVDCTGSMGGYIQSAQQNIVKIIESIQASEKVDVRFGLISYRDHPPQDSSYVTQIFDFTTSISTAQKNVNSMAASGGGDGPESVCCGLYEALHLKWREDAVKIAIFVSDAPPHGLHDALGDGFPEGCPDGRDPMKIAKEMAEKDIIVYCIGCEPSLSSQIFVKQWFCAIAQITGGRYVSLSNAQSLPHVIIYGAEEEMKLEEISNQVLEEEVLVKKEYESQGKEIPSCEEIHQQVASRLAEKGVKINALNVANSSSGSSETLTEAEQTLVNLMSDISTMKEVKEFLKTQSPPQAASAPSYAAPSRSAYYAAPESFDDFAESFAAPAVAPAPASAGFFSSISSAFGFSSATPAPPTSAPTPGYGSVPYGAPSYGAPAAYADSLAPASVSSMGYAPSAAPSEEVYQAESSINYAQVHRLLNRKNKK